MKEEVFGGKGAWKERIGGKGKREHKKTEKKLERKVKGTDLERGGMRRSLGTEREKEIIRLELLVVTEISL